VVFFFEGNALMKLRKYQEESDAAVWHYLQTQPGNPIVVLPTGAGKTLVICHAAKRAIEEFNCPGVLILSHVAELIEQVASTMQRMEIDHSVYSAGLGRREAGKITIASIQSIVRNPGILGPIGLVLIDECHRVGMDETSMYRKLIADLEQKNSRMRILGLSATPFRLDSGPLVQKGSIWSRIVYEAKIKRLIEEGFLCPMTNQVVESKFDLSKLQMVGKDFSDSSNEAVFGPSMDLQSALLEIAELTTDRNSTIVFCSSVAAAEMAADILDAFGGAVCVHGGLNPLERAAAISAHRNGEVQYIANCEILTTGYDATNIDCVAVLRATASAGLFCQMAGRGFRIHPGKKDCLLLDYGGNIQRHGPLDAIDYGFPRKPGQGEAPSKLCPNCKEKMHIALTICQFCGFEQEVEQKEEQFQVDKNSKVYAEPEMLEVSGWSAMRWKKRSGDGPDTMRVDYEIEGDMLRTVSEWVCMLHDGFAGQKARQWWSTHKGSELIFDESIDDDWIDVALRQFSDCLMPERIEVIQEGKYFRVKSKYFPVAPAYSDEEVPF